MTYDWDAPPPPLETPFPPPFPPSKAVRPPKAGPDVLLTSIIVRYRYDRAAFAQEMLGLSSLEPWQIAHFATLDRGCTRLSIRSGHGVGKTCFLAVCILHFMFTHFPCKVAVTAPSAPQLFDALAAEVRIWLKKLEALHPQFKGLFDSNNERVFMRFAPESSFCTYRTSRKENPEALQGIHADNVLLVADEASGVAENVYEAAAGSMSTRGAITILAGNPTRATGFFFNTHTKLRKVWTTVKVPCRDSSRVDPAYIEEERLYGETSNRYRVRVLGEFPEGDDDTLISRSLVEAATRRDVTAPRFEPVYWGLDVARSLTRDKSSLAKRKGPVCLEKIKRWQYDNVMQLCGVIMLEWDKTPERERPASIFVDVIGVGGGVVDRLRELELPVVGINVGESSGVMQKASRLRDELWLNARDWFATNVVKFPDDPDTIEELVTPTVVYQSNGNAKVESKDDMRSRGVLDGRSPDGADAFNLTFSQIGAITAGALQGTLKKGALHRKNTRRV